MSGVDLVEVALTAVDLRQALQAAGELAQRPDELPSFLTLLAAALSDARPQTARRAALIHGALGKSAQGNLPALLGALAVPRWTVREAVLQALSLVAPEDEAVQSAFIRRALFDRTAAVRDLALALLRPHVPSALPQIRLELANAYPRIRARTLHAMSRLAPEEEQVAVLLRALDDSHFRVRRDAARLLGCLGGAALPALPRLARVRFDGEKRVAAAAARSLAQIAEGLPAGLLARLTQLTAQGDPQQALVAGLTGELSVPQREAFIAVCQRRSKWLNRRQEVCPEPMEADPVAHLQATLAAAGKRADREAAWLLGWLLAELMRKEPATAE